MNMSTFKRNFNFDDENLMETVSCNIRKYRIAKDITQEQLAVDIGMSHDYYRRFESQKGREGISIRSLYRISKVLDVPIDKFFE